jgi:hypothetical protein
VVKGVRCVSVNIAFMKCTGLLESKTFMELQANEFVWWFWGRRGKARQTSVVQLVGVVKGIEEDGA